MSIINEDSPNNNEQTSPLKSVINSLNDNRPAEGNEALEAALRNSSLLDLSDMIGVDTHFDRDLKFIHKNIRFSIDIKQCLLIRQVQGIRWEYKLIIDRNKFISEGQWCSVAKEEYSNIETMLSIKLEMSNVIPFAFADSSDPLFQIFSKNNGHFESFRYERGGVLFVPSEAMTYTQFDKVYLSNVASIISFCVEKDTSSRFLSSVYRNLKNLAQQAQSNPDQYLTKSIPAAYLDDSSGLPNQAGFLRLLRHLIDSGQSHFSVAVLSLDKFAYFCNLFDESIKKRFLEATIERINSILTENSSLSHIGPSELAFVMIEQDHEVVNQKILEIINVFSEDLQVDDIKVRFEICAGFSNYPSCGEQADLLLKMANVALYRATQKNSDRLIAYKTGMEKSLQLHLELGRSIRQAIDRDEFEVFFQPIMTVTEDASVCHYEALIRWMHPVEGMISPVLFIEIAEASGDIIPLGYWVTERVCQHLATKEVPDNVCVSINLSPVQIRESKLAQNMRDILERYQVTPDRVTFEITETAAMLDPVLTRQRFEELRMNGFKLSVDDFGTGHSSLSYLLNFSFEYLKIDKSFIDHSSINDGYAVIASSMIQMAHKLNMIVICEGIETYAQQKMVKEWGADMLQGYLLSKPLPMHNFYPKETVDK
jgi:EAL domain-containing protein (putative c-di-GMP-specific phosphodiesterase class I)/GGDEF domain-containing protein